VRLMSRSRRKRPVDPVVTTIASLSHEGRGIARIDGKTVFIDGALPGEEVSFKYARKRGEFDEGYVVDVLTPSKQRFEPECKHFSICGGCSLMHLNSDEQILHKQSVLLEQLSHIGGVAPGQIIPPLTSSHLGYRHKARLGVKYVTKKEKVLVGFREKRSSFVADIQSCRVLHPLLGGSIEDLKKLIQGLSIYHAIPQLEVAMDDHKAAVVIRHLRPLNDEDRYVLDEFEKKHKIKFYLQPGGANSVVSLSERDFEALSYRLDTHDINIEFRPGDFTQINFSLNRLMVDKVIACLQPSKNDSVLDLFCGLGNFTLPIARYVKNIKGIEGSTDLVNRAKHNAQLNSIVNTEFIGFDLSLEGLNLQAIGSGFNKIVIDPPRSGALEIIRQYDFSGVERLVYVSCNPATLARDAGILVKEKGFGLKMTGVMDMFPHTSHVESIAVFG